MRTVRRHHYLIRMRFHDWLWQGSAEGKRFRRWIAPKLPIYLSDPELPATKRGRAKLFDRIEAIAESTTGPPPRVRVIRESYSGFVISPPTSTVGSSSNFIWNWR